MDTLNRLGMTAGVVVGIYLALFLSYILIPACVFLFVYYVLKEIGDEEAS